MPENINPPVFLNALVAGNCNLCCPFCLSWRRNLPQMGGEEWKKFFSDLGQWLPGRHISLSGGEPLLHPDIDTIAKSAVDAGLLGVLCTSGSNFSVETVRQIASWNLEGITISLDGPANVHDKLRGMEGLYDKIIGFIDYLKELSPEIKITTTSVIAQSTLPTLKKLTEMLLEKPQVNHVSFQAVTAQSDGKKDGTAPIAPPHFPGSESASRFLDWLLDISADNPKIKNSTRQIAVWKTYFESPMQVRTLMPHCHIGHYTLTVSPNGEVFLCDYFHGVGNVKTDHVREIWEGVEATKRRADMKTCTHSCNTLINCGFEDFHLRLLDEDRQREYFACLESLK